MFFDIGRVINISAANLCHWMKKKYDANENSVETFFIEIVVLWIQNGKLSIGISYYENINNKQFHVVIIQETICYFNESLNNYNLKNFNPKRYRYKKLSALWIETDSPNVCYAS